MKQCSKCKEWKELSEFYKDKWKKDGKDSWCKKCRKISGEKYYINDKEKIKNRVKNYRENNKEKVKKSKKVSYLKNKKYNLEKEKEYYLNNREQKLEKNKIYYCSFLKFDSKSKYRKEIKLYEEIKESSNGNLMCKCAYCGKWFEPSIQQVSGRIKSINGKSRGENRLYCSNKCKINCPIYGQQLYPKGFKLSTSREVQPELRQMVFKRDNYICQNCNKHKDELEIGLHCHHKEGILWEPLESADIDMCITLCENCHKKVHQKEGCGYQDMQCTG